MSVSDVEHAMRAFFPPPPSPLTPRLRLMSDGYTCLGTENGIGE